MPSVDRRTAPTNSPIGPATAMYATVAIYVITDRTTNIEEWMCTEKRPDEECPGVKNTS
jgi:hypothetical protein